MIKVVLCSRGVYGVISGFLTEHLESEEGLEIHDHCDPQDLPAMVPDLEPDVVLTVVGIPGKQDLENIATIRRAYPGCPIIAVSLALDMKTAVEPLIEAGATRIVAAEEALRLPNVIRQTVSEAGALKCVRGTE